MTTIRRNIIELTEIPDGVDSIEDIRQLMNQNITEINFILRSLTLVNLDGEIISASIPANGTLEIPHKLRIIPKYRVIIAQSGGGVIRDIEFAQNFIKLENLGSSVANISVIVVKD